MSDAPDGIAGKVILTLIVLVLSPFVEVVTGLAPIGTMGALAALTTIWGIDLLDPESNS